MRLFSWMLARCADKLWPRQLCWSEIQESKALSLDPEQSVDLNHLLVGQVIFASGNGLSLFFLFFLIYLLIFLLVTCLVPSHHLNKWWLIISQITGNKLHWNLKQHKQFHRRKLIWKCHLQNGGHFVYRKLHFLSLVSKHKMTFEIWKKIADT